MSEVGVGRRTERSAALHERALRVLVDGVSPPSRGPLDYRPHPLLVEGEPAAALLVLRRDLMLVFGALVHGYAHPGRRGSSCTTQGSGMLGVGVGRVAPSDWDTAADELERARERAR